MSLTHTFLLAARQQEIAELQTLNGTCELVRRTGELIHALQAERGSANACLASRELIFHDRWQQKCAMTDKAVSDLNELLNDRTPIAGTSRLYARIALAVHAMGGLSAHRAKVAALVASPVEITAHYSTIISALIALIFEAIDTTVEPSVARLLLALFNLIEGKEYAGLERANGVRLLAAQHADMADQQMLAQLIERQEQSLTRFESFCGDDVCAQWDALQTTLPLHELERLRRQLLTPAHTLTKTLVDTWFDVCSACIDGLHLVERHLADLIEAACRSRIAETEALLHTQQQSMDAAGALPETWRPTDHEQHLGSGLNRALMDLLQRQSIDLQSMSAELSSVRAVLEDRKMIERAKGLLMAQQRISEEAAYSLLRQKAMDQNARIGDVASALLAIADFFPAPKH